MRNLLKRRHNHTSSLVYSQMKKSNSLSIPPYKSFSQSVNVYFVSLVGILSEFDSKFKFFGFVKISLMWPFRSFLNLNSWQYYCKDIRFRIYIYFFSKSTHIDDIRPHTLCTNVTFLTLWASFLCWQGVKNVFLWLLLVRLRKKNSHWFLIMIFMRDIWELKLEAVSLIPLCFFSNNQGIKIIVIILKMNGCFRLLFLFVYSIAYEFRIIVR